MYRVYRQKTRGMAAWRLSVRWGALLAALCMIFVTASCSDNTVDDKDLTESLVKSYMESFCSYDISNMNKNSLSKWETYPDGDEVVTSCKLLASKIKWSVESINVSGNSAIAQVSVTLPADWNSICQAALDDAMMQLEQDSDRLPAEVIHSAIKNYANKADKTAMTVEITMSKVNNKWYITKSQDVNEILSEIRTSVAAVYSVIGQ